MMRFATLLRHPADWMMGHGAETSVVLTSRVRLARNLAKSPFPGWSRKKDREGVYSFLREKVESVPGMKDGFSHELCDYALFLSVYELGYIGIQKNGSRRKIAAPENMQSNCM